MKNKANAWSFLLNKKRRANSLYPHFNPHATLVHCVNSKWGEREKKTSKLTIDPASQTVSKSNFAWLPSIWLQLCAGWRRRSFIYVFKPNCSCTVSISPHHLTQAYHSCPLFWGDARNSNARLRTLARRHQHDKTGHAEFGAAKKLERVRVCFGVPQCRGGQYLVCEVSQRKGDLFVMTLWERCLVGGRQQRFAGFLMCEWVFKWV